MNNNLQRFAQCTLIQIFKSNNTERLLLIRNYRTEPKINERKKEKTSHPYKNVHPWKSIYKFSKDLIDNVIYNKDGIVVLNKPYGISNKSQNIIHRGSDWNSAVGIPNSVDYTLQDILPDIADKLGYSSLLIVKSPERNISGISILASDQRKAKAISKSLDRAQAAKTFVKKYWVVTSKLPKSSSGELNLAITKKESPCKTYKQPIILTKWGSNEVKKGIIKKFDVRYQTISNASEDLASLMEIECFVTKWHAIRVFASTVLLSPILGDKIHGSRVRKLMGTYMHISPFVAAARELPILEEALLKKLQLVPSQTAIIPTHIHLREMELISFPTREQNLKLVAPLPPSFQWTCDQLQIKIPTENEEFLDQKLIAASE